jgi:transcription elongation GreA/GreB family factor
MKSKREVAGIEASYLANGLAQTIEERAAWIRTLSALRLPDAPERVCLGSLVGLGPGGESVAQLFLILPVCGGTEVPVGNGYPPLRILTPGSAMAQALMGKALGDEFSLGRGAESLEVRLIR